MFADHLFVIFLFVTNFCFKKFSFALKKKTTEKIAKINLFKASQSRNCNIKFSIEQKKKKIHYLRQASPSSLPEKMYINTNISGFTQNLKLNFPTVYNLMSSKIIQF